MKANAFVPFMLRRGDGSTLSLDFTTMSGLDSRFTFTRASIGTYIDSAGLVASVSNDAPRFDHDPSTLAPRGLLLEGSATNLLKHSQGLFTSWISFGTVGALTTGITSPSGDSSAVSLDLNTAGNNGYYTNNTQMGYTNTVGATYTFSIWVRATGSTTNLNIRLGDSAVGYSANIPITTSWQRLQYSYVAVAASGPLIASATGTATGVVELWGAQLEVGSGASSYIPTGAGTVQRAADSCVMDGANFSSWFNASEGTILVRVGARLNTGSNRAYTFLPASGSANQIFEGSGTALNVYTSSSFVAQIGTSPISTSSNVCGAYRLDDYAVSVNGGAVVTDTSGAVPSSLTRLTIGGSAINASAANNGPISLFKYWPTRLPDATLQALST